jgi:hypothetical protein
MVIRWLEKELRDGKSVSISNASTSRVCQSSVHQTVRLHRTFCLRRFLLPFPWPRSHYMTWEQVHHDYPRAGLDKRSISQTTMIQTVPCCYQIMTDIYQPVVAVSPRWAFRTQFFGNFISDIFTHGVHSPLLRASMKTCRLDNIKSG